MKYMVEPGRWISLDGVPLFAVHIGRDPESGYSFLPVQADAMARYIAELLNKAGGHVAFERYMKRYMANPARPRRTARRRGLMKDVQFFRRHAGGIVGEATKGALSLARAEREMLRRDWVVLWEPDEDADLSWMDEEQQEQDHDVYCAVLVAPTKRTGSSTSDVLASLCGIVDPSQEYKRVVEAELAAEALARDT